MTQEGPGDADTAGPGTTVSEWQELKALFTWGHPFAERLLSVGKAWKKWEGVRRVDMNLCLFFESINL